jgi:zinc transporter 1/2/3
MQAFTFSCMIFLLISSDLDISTSYVEHLHAKPSAPPTPVSSLPPSRPTSPKPSALPTSSSHSIPSTHPHVKVAVSLTENTPSFSTTKPAAHPALTRGTIESLAPSHNAHPAHHSHHAHHSHVPIIPAAAVAGLPIEILTNSPRICRLTVVHEHAGCHTKHHHPHETVHIEPDEVHHDEEHHPSIGRRRQIVGILVRVLRK